MRLCDLKPGDRILISDPWADCLGPETHIVRQDDKTAAPYIKCSNGKHLLDGHVGPDGHLIGITTTEEVDV